MPSRTPDDALNSGVERIPMNPKCSALSLPAHSLMENSKTQSVYICADEEENYHLAILKDILHVKFPLFEIIGSGQNQHSQHRSYRVVDDSGTGRTRPF